MTTHAITAFTPRRLMGFAILAGGALALGHELWLTMVFHDPRVADALLAGLMAAGATTAGTLPVLFSRRLSEKIIDTLLGFGAGVMLAATAFSLIIPALESAKLLGFSAWQASAVTGSGILIGGAFLLLIDHLLPHNASIGGLKVVTENGWFAARPSGTEDIYKIYGESFKGESHLRDILSEAQTIVDAALG